MRRRVLWVSVAVTLLSAVGALGYTIWGDQRSGDLVAEALETLHPPLGEAPGLDRVHASAAVSLLERAQEGGRADNEVLGWLAYARALEDYQRGDLLLSEGELTTAGHRLGDHPDVLVLRAAVARGRQQEPEAMRALAEALELEPEHVHGNLLAADLALDQEEGPAALRHLERLGPDVDAVAPVHNRRGLAHELLGEVDLAEASYRRAVELDEGSHQAWINLGRLHRRAGNHASALECFDAAVRAQESDSDAHLGRGLARAAVGDGDGAQTDFQRAAELAPNDAEPLLALGDLLRDTGHYDEAVSTYREAISREDADAASWLKLGNALALLEDYGEAADAFRAALRRSPELAAALNGLGASLMHTGEQESAMTALTRAAELDPNDPNPLMNLALLHERAGDLPAARDAWTRALERDPRSSIARRRLARLQAS